MAAGEDVVTDVQIERYREKDERPEPEMPATELGRRTKAELEGPRVRACLALGFGWFAPGIRPLFALVGISQGRYTGVIASSGL